MAESQKSESDLVNPETVILVAGAVAVLCAVAYCATAWPVFVWSSVNLHPRLMAPGRAIGGALHWFHHGVKPAPASIHAWASYRHVLPPTGVWLALDALLVVGLLMIVSGVMAQMDRSQRRAWLGLRPWDPRGKAEPRSWAAPRDLVHLQPRESISTGRMRKAVASAERATYRQREASQPAGGDSWPLGKLRGRELRSAREMHLMVVAPTRSGKTTRVVIPAAREHRGPAIVLSNKVDVVKETISQRERRPVWIYAPMSETVAGRYTSGWTPIQGCEEWDYALRVGRWMFEADPASSAASDQSGGARFYNREAVGALLPPLLHAAALGKHSMGDVLGWLRGGVDALDEPRHLLTNADALRAADQLAGVQALDERPRSLLTMSAAQLVDVYRFPSAQESDRADFDPHALLRSRGTLYLIAPESEQDALAPLFGGVLGAVLRTWESAAATGREPPLLKILADEAAQLAPLDEAAELPGGVRRVGRAVVLGLPEPVADPPSLRHRGRRDPGQRTGQAVPRADPRRADTPVPRRAARRRDDDAESHSEIGFGRRPSSTTSHERQRPKVSAQQLMQLAAAKRSWSTAATCPPSPPCRRSGSDRGCDDRCEHPRRERRRVRRLPGVPHGGTGARRLLPRHGRRAGRGAGRWLRRPQGARAGRHRLDHRVEPKELRALMAGRQPRRAGVAARAPAPDGQRAGGIDVTFSAPKAVSSVWALAGAERRPGSRRPTTRRSGPRSSYLRETVELTARWTTSAGERAGCRSGLHAAEFMHTTARGVAGRVPDPQLHSHVVITSVERHDGAVAAVRSRPVLRSAREVGAYYRANTGRGAARAGLRDRAGRSEAALLPHPRRARGAGAGVQQAHRRGPSRGAAVPCGARTRAGARRAARPGGRRRDAKLPRDSRRARRRVAHHRRPNNASTSMPSARTPGLRPRTVATLANPRREAATAGRAMFDERALRAVALEQAAGCAIAPARARALRDELRRDGRVLDLAAAC